MAKWSQSSGVAGLAVGVIALSLVFILNRDVLKRR